MRHTKGRRDMNEDKELQPDAPTFQGMPIYVADGIAGGGVVGDVAAAAVEAIRDKPCASPEPQPQADEPHKIEWRKWL